jgi:signal transduction histidine kinase/ActR/RegA family two-component response regulator
MDIQPRQLRSESHAEVGDLIRRDAGLIIARWARRATEEQPKAARAHHDVLLDHLPALLQQMGRSLAEPDPDDNGWHRSPATEHGEQRWESGWSLAEVVRDYQILRIVILNYLEETLDRALGGREVMAIGLILDESIGASVSRYGQHQKEAARQAERERAENEKMSDELRHTREATTLKEAERRKDEFLAVVAHELRNHLAPVVSAAGILGLEGSATPTAQQARETISRQLQQMARLVGDLLDVARLKQGKLSLQRKSMDLAEVLTQAVETARPLIDAGSHHLTVSVPSDAPLCVDGDAGRLTQVFVNLLTNAAKYTQNGGNVGLAVTREGGQVVVRVKDDGVGIPPDQLDRVFDLFAQAEGAEGERGGLGVGLALVKSLVELHGGAVVAHSGGSGQGAEFIVRLPVASDQFPGVAPEGGPCEPSRSAQTRRILVVDDNRDSADTLGVLLELMGHLARTAYDGPQALDMVREFWPEIVLLDIGLPTLGGYEVARRLRGDPAMPSLVLVALSGYGAEEDRQRSREAGFDHHLVKPCALEDLEALLREPRPRDCRAAGAP